MSNGKLYTWVPDEGADTPTFTLEGGQNVITGDEGADQFWIAVAEIPESANTITDFESGVDVLGIIGLGIGFEDLSLTQDGDKTLIATGEKDLAILLGVEVDSLSSDNFVFVFNLKFYLGLRLFWGCFFI
ncbi:MAG: hypothetical protein IGR93_21295 [Hydrococcus sp. C42_A2020_068]|nr:hypothetical protein [Pleurocapsa sp. PCC 7327]MBF2022551.1 hypothetical protein [Hydrococcus sp. C42_A2020_068]